MTTNPDAVGFGVYLHWPFCAAKCPYCDFNSHVRAAGVDEARYLAAFAREIRHCAGLIGPRSVSSVFIGGGTPSLLKPATVSALLETVDRAWTLEAGAEITLEANPNSVDAERFAGYRAAGVNRVSIGVQALDDASLKALGRLHSASEARAAIDIARRTFSRSSFDLIYARPGQSPKAWRQELAAALDLANGHLSIYQLTIEEGTAYFALHAAGKLVLPEDGAAEEMYEIAQQETRAAGMPAYEVSNHARSGDECRHNLLYWRYGEYAGIGPGAHGRVIVDGQRTATETERSPEAWLARVEAGGTGVVEQAVLTDVEIGDEALLMGLRLEEGLDLGRLAAISGRVPGPAILLELVADGLLQRSDGGRRLAVTERGRFLLNTVIARLAARLEPVS
jgi:putative oxygen-independent coproporphyrinogen III oxidase